MGGHCAVKLSFHQSALLTITYWLLYPLAALAALAVVWISKQVKQSGDGIQSSIGELNHVTAETFASIRDLRSLSFLAIF